MSSSHPSPPAPSHRPHPSLGRREIRCLHALYAGRLWNCFWFLFQQAVFFGALHEKTKRCAGRLVRRLDAVLRPRAREAAGRALRDRLRGMTDFLGGEGHLEWCEEADADFARTDEPGSRFYYRSPAEARGVLLDGFRREFDELRRLVADALDTRALAFFQLGEAVDQGGRPEDVYRHLDATPEPFVGPPAPPRFGRSRPAAASAAKAPVGLAAETRRWGDVAPPPEWWGDLRARWRATRLRRPPPNRPPELHPAARAAKEAADAVHEALAALRPTRLRPCPPAPPRLRIVDREAKEVRLDGQVFFVPSAPAFRILDVLIQAGGDVVATEKLKNLPGCRVRQLNKLLAPPGLPPELRGVIKGRRGSGGYYLRLPPRSRP